jgi:hypothetical protein
MKKIIDSRTPSEEQITDIDEIKIPQDVIFDDEGNPISTKEEGETRKKIIKG